MTFSTLQLGATGERVRELHERLENLGLHSGTDAKDVFGEPTMAVVQAFQRSRGLPITGEVDATTWQRLLEAGFALGQRLLYLTRPNLRGDDVAELQVRLAQLGFNPGRIDGIFGPLLSEALSDFQRNCAVEPDGVLTRVTLQELLRLGGTFGPRSLVTDARDRAGFNSTATGPVVVCGEGPLLSLLSDAIARVRPVVVLEQHSPEQVASYANTNQAALVVSLQPMADINGVHLHYWASYRSHSRQGEHLASEVASAFSSSPDLPRVEVTGMALPILRETRMITLHIEYDASNTALLTPMATAISDVIGEVIHN